jgi:hypothetical protein
MTPQTVKEALMLQAGATMKRAVGRSMIEDYGDHTGGRFELAEAEDMETAASAFLEPVTHVTGPVKAGNGGELVVATREAMAKVPGIIDTLRESPDMLNAQASRDRLELTGNTLPMAVDAAETIGARNSLEKMLAHQMAAGHALAMNFANRAGEMLEQHRSNRGNQALSIEAARMGGTAARLMGAYQDALVALERFRRGGRQTVKVVHQTVAVAPGGQAVVAGSMRTGGKRRGKALK